VTSVAVHVMWPNGLSGQVVLVRKRIVGCKKLLLQQSTEIFHGRRFGGLQLTCGICTEDRLFSVGRGCESLQALLEGSRYFIKQVDVVRLQSPASDTIVPEMRYRFGCIHLLTY